jgi:membrane-bound ClpP family serine protease
VSLVALAAILIMSHAPTLTWIILAAVGSILLLIGVLLFLMELTEPKIHHKEPVTVRNEAIQDLGILQ